MRTLTIYKRTILERTRYKSHRYKECEQTTIIFGGETYRNHDVDLDNPRLKVKFEIVLETNNEESVERYIESLGKSNNDKWEKEVLKQILDDENKADLTSALLTHPSVSLWY